MVKIVCDRCGRETFMKNPDLTGRAKIGSEEFDLCTYCVLDIKRFINQGTADRKTEPTGDNLSPVEDETTVSKMEQVEMMSCAECIHKPIGAEICEEPCHYAPKDESQTEQWHYDEKDNTWYPYQHKSCVTCKHALGNWDGESNNCGRCCGADRRFYEPIEAEPQAERNE